MSEIPEDVMETALGVVSAQWELGYDRNQATLTDLIARAILAERERCAQIAEGIQFLDKPGRYPLIIADAIRGKP